MPTSPPRSVDTLPSLSPASICHSTSRREVGVALLINILLEKWMYPNSMDAFVLLSLPPQHPSAAMDSTN